MNVLPMENIFTYLSYPGGNPAVKKLYVQLTPPARLLNARAEARNFNAQAMDHPLFGHPSDVTQAIERLHGVVPHLSLADVSPMLDELRSVKTPFVIERLRTSGRIGAAEKMYRCILEARNAIIAAMKPGASIESLQNLAEPIYARYGYGEQFKAWGRYVGHFVGISVHDVEDITGDWAKRAFVTGTVFNVEPLLDSPERKAHVRLEDTVLITENGAENLTASVPAELDPLYALIKQPGVKSTPLSDRTER
ncbi:MAG: M24 family metallopeptidase [Gemmatimonadales bacterium]